MSTPILLLFEFVAATVAVAVAIRVTMFFYFVMNAVWSPWNQMLTFTPFVTFTAAVAFPFFLVNFMADGNKFVMNLAMFVFITVAVAVAIAALVLFPVFSVGMLFCFD